jgi:hypothetical protein
MSHSSSSSSPSALLTNYFKWLIFISDFASTGEKWWLAMLPESSGKESKWEDRGIVISGKRTFQEGACKVVVEDRETEGSRCMT